MGQSVLRKQVKSKQRPAHKRQKSFRVFENTYAISSYPFRLYLLILFLVGLALFIKVFLLISITRDSIKIEAVNQKIEKLEMNNEKTRLEQAQLKAPARVQKYAIEKLNMINPEEVNYIHLPEDVIRKDIEYKKEIREKEEIENNKAEKIKFITFLSTVTSRIGVVALGDILLFKN